jgi:hypothetical protein
MSVVSAFATRRNEPAALYAPFSPLVGRFCRISNDSRNVLKISKRPLRADLSLITRHLTRSPIAQNILKISKYLSLRAASSLRTRHLTRSPIAQNILKISKYLLCVASFRSFPRLIRLFQTFFIDAIGTFIFNMRAGARPRFTAIYDRRLLCACYARATLSLNNLDAFQYHADSQVKTTYSNPRRFL